MGNGPSDAIKLFGTEEPAGEARTLQAGPLDCTLEAGNLRYIRFGGVEAIRAVSFIVRDHNWGTFAPRLDNLDIEQSETGFAVTYDATCGEPGQGVRYRARITGDSRGRLAFEVEGEALGELLTNRTGFVVLHGVEGVAGAPLEVLHIDGRAEQTRFPELISPSQPVMDIAALTHEPAPGVRVTCRMEGDAFEMEDQRNWLDASYKTYIRPLSKPWPYTLRGGERFAQKIEVEISGEPPARAGGAPVELARGEATARPMPRLGLAVPAAYLAAAERAAATLRMARPSFIVAEMDLRQGHGATELAAYARLAAALDAELVVEAVLPCADATGRPTADPAALRADLARLREAAAKAGVAIGRLVLTPACYLKSYQPDAVWPEAPPLEVVYAEARKAFPDTLIGGGMLSYFTELNRKRPPAAALDFVGHSLCPLVHAGDDVSLTEGLETLPTLLASTRAFAGGKPYWLYPTAISMRANPYGTAPLANPDNVRTAMSTSDPRERGLIGAAWYAGLVAHAARGGLEAVTMGAAAGPSGLVYAPLAWAQPWFDGTGSGMFPSFHVFRELAATQGAVQVETRSSRPREVQAIAVRSAGGTRLWLVNLTGEARTATISGIADRSAQVRAIDADSFETLCRDAGAEMSATTQATAAVALKPYAVLRLDFSA